MLEVEIEVLQIHGEVHDPQLREDQKESVETGFEVSWVFDEMVDFSSYSVLSHPLTVQGLSEILVAVEFGDVLHRLLPHHLVLL